MFAWRNRSRSVFRPFGGLARDQGGAIAIILALCLGVIAGMMALAMDLGKAWNLETEFQHAADACALAGATQLNGLDGARVRAIEACTNTTSKLIDNEQTFASDGLGAAVTFDTKKTFDGDGKSENRDIKFYTVLPISAAVEAKTDAEARFVEANVFPRRVDFSFAAVVGAVTSASPRARALAGFETFYCDSPPMMMCNPNEDPGGNPNATFDFYTDCPDYGPGTEDINGKRKSCQGRGITMKAQKGQLTQGNFGFLSITVMDEDGTVTQVGGTKVIQEALASVDYDAVCTGNAITTEPGNRAAVDRYINMRFDLYFKAEQVNDPNKQPARVTNRGLMPDATLDPSNGNCVFNPIAGSPNPGHWNKPTPFAIPNEGFNGPGWHNPNLNNAGFPPLDADGNPLTYTSLDDAFGTPYLWYEDGTGMGVLDAPIKTMAFPKDSCNYPAVQVNAGYNVDGPPLGTGFAAIEGCLFAPPVPDDPTTPKGIQVGSGQWDAQAYLDLYHPGYYADDRPGGLLDPASDDYADLPDSLNPFRPVNGLLARWEVYNWEKRIDAVADDYPNMPYEGEPQCYKPGQTMDPTPVASEFNLGEAPMAVNDVDRRIIVMAVANCEAMGGGKQTVYRTEPHGNIAVFMTEPMGLTVPDALMGELVDPLGIGAGDVALQPTLVRKRILLLE